MEKRVHVFVGQHPDALEHCDFVEKQSVGGGEGKDEIARSVRPVAADSTETNACPLRKSLALGRQQRRVGSNNDDDRPFVAALWAVADVIADVPTDRHAVDRQVTAVSIVGLN